MIKASEMKGRATKYAKIGMLMKLGTFPGMGA